ncbi:hypothetical protein [Natronomonas sp. EA1]
MTNSDRNTMKDVSHTPPTGEPVSDVWARGNEAEDTNRAETPADD